MAAPVRHPNNDPFKRLPPDIVNKIAYYLDHSSTESAREVNQLWQRSMDLLPSRGFSRGNIESMVYTLGERRVEFLSRKEMERRQKHPCWLVLAIVLIVVGFLLPQNKSE